MRRNRKPSLCAHVSGGTSLQRSSPSNSLPWHGHLWNVRDRSVGTSIGDDSDRKMATSFPGVQEGKWTALGVSVPRTRGHRDQETPRPMGNWLNGLRLNVSIVTAGHSDRCFFRCLCNAGEHASENQCMQRIDSVPVGKPEYTRGIEDSRLTDVDPSSQGSTSNSSQARPGTFISAANLSRRSGW